ncbi:N-acetylmuramoyl-L-alanine amidase [Cohnella fermenti]|uniref:N-acetylmuramoyl-L-alanine amidase n=2 Tax=Cohnella fermenti TaxID=2565925 RepID=A0A4S4BPE5_9BACL|nr:N-acetylmuramoyl-L-alanine amidase [Cohnella fermenti]
MAAASLLGGWAPALASEPERQIVPSPLPPLPPARHTLPAAEVLIDAGHGGIDSGTHWGDVLEKDINLAISRKLYLVLRGRGIQAVLNRTGDYALSDDNRWQRASRHNRDLSQRKGLSDMIEPELFVSVHVNWSKRGNNRGPIVIHQNEGRSALLGSFIQDGLNRQQNSRRLPMPSKKYFVLSRVKMPSVIVETGFLSDPRDREMLVSSRGQSRIAIAIADGILAYFCVSPA